MITLGQPAWFGQYRLTSRVATGGMAEIYVGRHITPDGQFGPIVAVKRLLPHLAKDAAIVRMFLNEARITAQIHHPNVVKIFELGEANGEPFIAMELLEGRTWAELRDGAAAQGQRMPVGVALFILTEACRGLDAAHRAVDQDGHPLSLVHRDFTPDNIFVGMKGDVKVIDFGIAKAGPWGVGTEPGTLKGKFFYMSPEMINAQPVDHRADIFAAGVMLYEQLTGRRPFTGNSIDEVVLRIAREEPLPPSTYDPALPAALEAICLKALAREPAQRFQTLGELVAAIERVGGAAVVASADEAAAYLARLFPPQTDERRDTLRRARAADPSSPGQPISAAVAAALKSAPGVTSPTAPVVEVTPAPPPAQAPTRRAAPARALAALLALAVLGAAGGGLAYFLRQQALRSPAERLAAAAKTTGAERAGHLEGLARAPGVTAKQLEQAGALLAEGQQWETALLLVDGWLELHPASLEARLLEARAATETRKGKRAETAAREAAALAPQDGRPDAAMAALRELQGDAGAALEAWTRATQKAPGNAAWLARKGYWLSQTGRLDEAEAALTRSQRGKPQASTLAELGFVKFRKEQVDDALRLLRAAVKEDPRLLEGHYYLGAVLFRRGELAGARAAYLAADALTDTDTRPLSALCEMEQMQGTTELASVQQRIRERFPKDAAALLSKCAAAAPAP